MHTCDDSLRSTAVGVFGAVGTAGVLPTCNCCPLLDDSQRVFLRLAFNSHTALCNMRNRHRRRQKRTRGEKELSALYWY